MSAKKILIFNWKMAPLSLKKAKKLFNSILNSQSYILNSEIVVAPPSVYLPILSSVMGRRSSVKLASQDVFWENPSAGGGAYTGEISPTMLKNLGVEYVLIGHSERRKYLNETDEMINKKVLAALKAGLKVVLCVGEPERAISDKRQATRTAKKYVKNQLEKDLKNISSMSHVSLSKSLIVAYEPIWAINTNHSDTPQDALEMIKYIKNILNSLFKIHNSKILYGGSINGKNIGDFLKHPEIDGALIGHASLKAGEVKKIVGTAS